MLSDKIIRKFAVNSNIVSNVLLGGYIVSNCPLTKCSDFIKIGTLIGVSVVTDGILVKKYLNRRKNAKKV